MSDRIVKNWLSLAEYDLATAEAMLQAKRYLYVAFMSEQAIEKILKACYVKQHDATPPYTHNLLRLLAELSWQAEMTSSMTEAMGQLNSYYIESRYTEDFEEVTRLLDDEEANKLLASAREIFDWIKTKL